jgi:hypothetical protein
MVARASAARQAPRDQDSCARGDIVVDDTVYRCNTLSAELAWYGTMDSPSPPLFSPNRIQPRRIDLILASS